jgi:pimeloyl-ACP methyl ester carboxylesterase
MPYVEVGDLSLYYEELGSADAPPLVLLHGAGGTIDDPVGGWAGLAPSFAEHYRLVLVEHRGHGRTGNPAGFMTFEQLGDDVAGLVDALRLGSVHVAGISDGGIVALDLALRRPDLTRTITVLGGNHATHDGLHEYAAAFDPDAIEQAAPEAAAAFAARHDQGKEPGFWKALLRQIIENNLHNPTWTEEDLRRIDCPTLLVAGENDPFVPLEQMVTMKREIPNAEWLIVNAAGHPVHFEHPEIVGPRILDFLERRGFEDPV